MFERNISGAILRRLLFFVYWIFTMQGGAGDHRARVRAGPERRAAVRTERNISLDKEIARR